MVNIQAKQAEINGMNYGDARVLDLQMLYFGDEVHLYIEDYIAYEENTEECWKLTFLYCGEVNYKTDAMWSTVSDDGIKRNWRDNIRMKDIKSSHGVGHDVQEITIEEYENEFYSFFVELGLMQLNIICRDIKVEKVKLADQHFFWQENTNDD